MANLKKAFSAAMLAHSLPLVHRRRCCLISSSAKEGNALVAVVDPGGVWSFIATV